VTAESLRGGLNPYALTDHIHECKARRHLSTLLLSGAPPLHVAFTPAVAPLFSGILALAFVPLAAPLAARDVWALFEARCTGERLVRLQRDPVVLPDFERWHGVCLGGPASAERGRARRRHGWLGQPAPGRGDATVHRRQRTGEIRKGLRFNVWKPSR
jgi:hypothetical protein